MEGVSFRTAAPADAEEIARTTELGFATFRDFMPEGWAPPPAELEPIGERLADPDFWCRVAEQGGMMAGHVALLPAALHSAYPDPDPELAHLGALFVREQHWGRRRDRGGGAPRLHRLQALHARSAGAGKAVLRTRGLDRGLAAIHGGPLGRDGAHRVPAAARLTAALHAI
jgi:hypothetical protein